MANRRTKPTAESGTVKSAGTRTAAEGVNPVHGSGPARRFGILVRERRAALDMSQNDLALAIGLGRRFIVDLEAGKPSCHLGKALLVAEVLGLQLFEVMAEGTRADNAANSASKRSSSRWRTIS